MSTIDCQTWCWVAFSIRSIKATAWTHPTEAATWSGVLPVRSSVEWQSWFLADLLMSCQGTQRQKIKTLNLHHVQLICVFMIKSFMTYMSEIPGQLTFRNSRHSCCSTLTASNTAFFASVTPHISIIFASSCFFAALMKEPGKLAPLCRKNLKTTSKANLNTQLKAWMTYFDSKSLAVSLWLPLVARLSGVHPWAFLCSTSVPWASNISATCVCPFWQAKCRGVIPSLSLDATLQVSFPSKTCTFLNTQGEEWTTKFKMIKFVESTHFS